jgi:hypothetical protein
MLGTGKTAPVIADEGHIAQNGPRATDTGSEVLAQAVPMKVDSKNAYGGKLVRQAQRSWLKEDAEANIPLKSASFVTVHPAISELKRSALENIC